MRDAEAAPLLDSLPDAERFETWHIVLRDGTLASGGAGGVDLLLSMRLTRKLGRLAAHVPVGVLELLYRAIASRRGTLGRLVPDGPGPRRFP